MSRIEKFRVAVVAGLPAIVLPLIATGAPPSHSWRFITPCINALTCQLPFFCWCETDWDDNLAWDLTCPHPCVIYDDYPSMPHDFVIIERSDVGTCSVGGAACSSDSDCSGSETCDDLEKRLELAIITVSIGQLTLITESTIATTDKLRVYLGPKGAGTKTLTVDNLVLDATAGEIWLLVNANAKLLTDSTD